MRKAIIFFTLAGGLLVACGVSRKQASMADARVVDEKLPSLAQPLQMGTGIPVYQSANVDYKRDGKSLLHLKFAQSVVIAVAPEPEKWGYFQFPGIGRERDGRLVVSWAMNADAMEAYGTEAGMCAYSSDEGKTWQTEPHKAIIADAALPNGDRLNIATPQAYQCRRFKTAQADRHRFRKLS